MYRSHLIGALCAVIFAFIMTTSQADLIGVLPATPNGTDYQAYYDTDTNLTWLANANAGAGTSYDDGSSTTDGLMTWANAKAWAAGLSINGVTGWRLPDTLVTCSGYHCTSSEMGNLFYNVLGGSAGVSITTTHNNNYNLFSNILPIRYWFANEYAPDTIRAWDFDHFGHQTHTDKTAGLYAWAVHVGNAGAVRPPYWAAIDPLALILRGDIYVKINLPRPPPIETLKARIEELVRTMTPEERKQALERVRNLMDYGKVLEQALGK